MLTFGEPVVSFALSNALQDCFFVPAGAVGLLRISIAALLPLWQGAV